MAWECQWSCPSCGHLQGMNCAVQEWAAPAAKLALCSCVHHADAPALPLQVVGLDFSGNMLQDAAARQRQRQQSGGPLYDMRWIQGDALRLPFEAASFDAATMGYGLRNVASIPTALQVGRAGGKEILELAWLACFLAAKEWQAKQSVDSNAVSGSP